MFLHAGASLHGHEYSPKSPPPAGYQGPKLNPLLRHSFAAHRVSFSPSPSPAPTATPPAPSPSPSPIIKPASSLRRPRFFSISSPSTPEPVVRFQTPENAMSEDEGSLMSDSDTSRTASSTRGRRGRLPKTATSYIMAQPAPTIGGKQRILHLRPRLVMQMQELSPDSRPRPMIDVYPSSAMGNSALAAPLLKRFPRLGRVKKTLNLQDVMLLKSYDYTNPTSDVESDEEDHASKRDLVAILSPGNLMTQDEIVLSDGTVWWASPRVQGNSFSYEFTMRNPDGDTIIARWVRRQVVTKSVPSTPTSGGPIPRSSSPALDSKFIFSMIDPSSRRHPILATLTPASLEIQDTYTTVSPSSGRYPPSSSQCFSPPESPTGEDMSHPFERTTLPVQEWQKLFIQVSAVWVALRHGWSASFRPGGLTSTPNSSSTSLAIDPCRARSLSSGPEGNKRFSAIETVTHHCATPVPDRPSSTVDAPRRATSTGAAFMERRRARQSSSEVEDAEHNGQPVMNENWNGSHTASRTPDPANRRLASDRRHAPGGRTTPSWQIDSNHAVDPDPSLLSRQNSVANGDFGATPNPGSAPSPDVSQRYDISKRPVSEVYIAAPAVGTRTTVSGHQRPMSEYFPPDAMQMRGGSHAAMQENPLRQLHADAKGTDGYDKGAGKHRRLRSLTHWLNKIKAH